jgi:LacI family transcriptional regulator
MPPPSRPVGIKDIARALGISTGTVDRALHQKPGVAPLTRTRVLRMAESLGYKPNLAARQLKSPRNLLISVHLPREIALFWDLLRDGIREAAAPFEPALQVEFRDYPRMGEGDVPLFKQALQDEVSGLIIAPGDPEALRPWIRKAARKRIPVVCVVTDAPGTERLTSVSADPFTVGAVAGEFLSRCLPAGGRVAFLTGWLGTEDHAEKLRGFEEAVRTTGRKLEIGSVVEAREDERRAYRRTLELLEADQPPRGIYVSTVNSLPVLRAIEQKGASSSVIVVTTDLFTELVPWLENGTVAGTVYQRPVAQGRVALRAIHRFLAEGVPPAPRLKVIPHLVMRHNLPLFLERGVSRPQTPPPPGPSSKAAGKRHGGGQSGLPRRTGHGR